MNKIIILIGCLIIVFIIGFIGSNYIGHKGWYLDNRPECYFLTGTSCMNGYDLVNLQGNYWSIIQIKQCCLRPHYLMQTNEPTLYQLKSFCDNVQNTAFEEVKND